MLLEPNEIRINNYYLGPGKGSWVVLQCEALGFSRDLDCSTGKSQGQSKAAAMEELDRVAHERFLSGEFTFPPDRQEKAVRLRDLSGQDLIAEAFAEDDFVRTFAKLELVRRDLFDADLYRLGEYGSGNAREQAIALLQQRAGGPDD